MGRAEARSGRLLVDTGLDGTPLPCGPYTLPAMSVVVGGWLAALMSVHYIGIYGGAAAATVATAGGVVLNWRILARDRQRAIVGGDGQVAAAGPEHSGDRAAAAAMLTARLREHSDGHRRWNALADAAGSHHGTEEHAGRIWRKANAIRGELRAAQAEYEFDLAEKLFRRPLLSDVNEPTTAAWLEALEAMELVMADDGPPTAADATKCLLAAEAARAAWKAADERAREIGLGQLSAIDARRLGQAHKLLTSALDRGTAEAERRVQVAKIIEILTVVTGRPKSRVGGEVQQAVNGKLASIGAPPLRLAIEGEQSSPQVTARTLDPTTRMLRPC